MAAERADAPVGRAEIDRRLAPYRGATGIGLAVSGGADSVALMRLVADWRARLSPELPIVAFTVDHGLRPESAAEAARVAGWAATVSVPHETLVWTGAKPGAGIQAAARAARYRLLGEACARHGLSQLMTAHHLDDQAETLLLRLARGSGVDGLAAMPEAGSVLGTPVARPLLDIAKSRLVATLQALGQDWIEDPSNGDARFARVRLRALMPALAAEGIGAARLAQTAGRMRRARHALEAAAADLHRAAVTADAAGFCRIDRWALAAAPEEIGLRVLARVLMGVGGADYPPRLERLERLYGLLCDAAGGGATLSGCRVAAADADVLVFRESGRAGLPAAPLAAPGSLVWDGRFRVDAGPAAGGRLTVRALGAAGLARVREDSRLRDIPAAAARVAPGVFEADRLVAAPSVEAVPGPFSPGGLSVTFVGAGRFAADPREIRA